MERSFKELSHEVASFIASASALQEWPECLQLLLDMLGDDEPWIHALPILSCQAAGGSSIDALPVAAAWITLLHAGNLIDDVQDGDFARLSQIRRPETAIAFSLAWIFSALRMLDGSSITTERRSSITNIFTRAGINSSRGQYQDLTSGGEQSNSRDMLAAYWEMVINKSGSIFMAGTSGGAATGTDQIPLIEALGDYGTALGVIRQVLDDCRDVWIDATVDNKQATLPLILQELAAGEKHSKKSEQPIGKAIPLLTESGIPEVIADILLEWRRRALASLQILEPSEARDALVYIFEYVMKPKPRRK